MHCDVLVVGGGVTGIAAATAAARTGVKVVLIEPRPFVGGNATTGLCLHNYLTKERRQVVFGIAQEVVDRLKDMGGAVGHVPYGGFVSAVTPVDGNLFRIMATELLADAGVQIIFGAHVVGTKVTNGQVTAAHVAMKEGVEDFVADCYVDCTGDADVAISAGAPYRKGEQHSGKMQPISMILHFYGVDTMKVADEIAEIEPAMAKRDDHPLPIPVYFNGTLSKWNREVLAENVSSNRDHKVFFNTVWPNQLNVNTSAVPHLDGTNSLDLSRATVLLTKQCARLGKFLQTYVPGFANSYFEPSMFPGVRESRNIKGLYEISDEDAIEGRKFEDTIGQVCFPVDIHDPDTGQAHFHDIGADGAFDIPYRALLPQTLSNVLVAGRCISATHYAHGATRNMAPCLVTGEAAGVAAGLSIVKNETPIELNVAQLQAELTRRGVFLGENKPH
jgi:FAD dependent oxidoreductase